MANRQMPAVSFMQSTGFSFWGLWAMLMWIVILLWSWVQAAFGDQKKVLFRAMVLCLLFNFVLHIFYGVGEKGRIEYFIYTCNFSYLNLLALTYLGSPRQRSVLVLLSVFLVTLMINNLTMFKEILHIYQ